MRQYRYKKAFFIYPMILMGMLVSAWALTIGEWQLEDHRKAITTMVVFTILALGASALSILASRTYRDEQALD